MKSGVIGLLFAAALLASSPATWELNTFQDFLKGKLTGVAINRDGKLTLAPPLRPLFDSGQPVIWSVVEAPDGTVYAGTGHKGRVYKIDSKGAGTLLWTSEQPEIFALAVQGGSVYAATSPDGKVYRIQNGKAAEYFDPKAKYIWSLAVAKDGALYVGTGDQGKVYRVTAPGQGELYYESGQAHVSALAIDSKGRLLAGTEPNGVLYRITAKDKAFVLYDANLPEIHSLAVAADGTIYASALGGGIANRVASSAAGSSSTSVSTSVSTPVASVTVTGDASAQSGLDVKPKPAEQPKTAVTATQAITTPSTPVIDLTGVEKSAIYKIDSDDVVETVWSSKEENAYDVLLKGSDLLVSTDKDGRIYSLAPDRKVTLLAQTNEGEAVRLLPAGNAFLVATGSLGKLYSMGHANGASGSYESPVHDASGYARWGKLHWRASDTGLAFSTRSGNTARPDKTWSDWSPPIAGGPYGAITSPNARYLQWKVDFTAPTATLESVSVSYLPQNTTPVLKNIITSLFFSQSLSTKPATAPGSATFTVTVSETGDAAGATAANAPTQVLARASSQQMLLSWQGEDADGDKLVYTVYAKGEGEREWKLLRNNLAETNITLDSEILADGKYLFRIVASDRLSNPPSTARETELISSPVLIDNTPPAVSLSAAVREASAIAITGQATDSASPLRRIEYSLDAGPWLPAEPVDGIVDSPQEAFRIRIEPPPPGEHILTVRAFDSANNVGLAKLVLR